MTVTDAGGAVDAVWRIESARIIAGVARIVRDVGLAEELAQDALVAALEQWPESGVPNNPGAWLMAIAKRRAIDLIRRKETYQRKLAEMGHELEIDGGQYSVEDSVERRVEAILEDHIEDDLLRLVFTACHPVLTMDARVTLTLKLLGGLKTDEIARAFLSPEATIAQRIVRAKRNLAKAEVQFEVPSGPDLLDRLQSVLEVVYLIYNEGYSATAGDDWMRPALCNEAMRLGRLLVELMPTEPEVLGLLALMELQSSRANARVGADGEPVLLLDQDRRRWDRLLIRRGLEGIDRAWALEKPPGPYLLQAAIAACHARAADPEDTDWARIAGLYAVLAQVTPSPVVELNQAVAISMAFGPEQGLRAVDLLADDPSLKDYHLLPSVRGDLLFKLGRLDEARVEFEKAAALTRNERERKLLLERAAACLPAGQ
ncbi:RNA polymerase sigma factor [Kribbella sp. NPDC050459]|uniref:RNA polymerase sigma factor n=1 Tax=Kribbella sp. NPDC050459 TaxID=3155785 RepID=UPI0033CB5661